MFELLLQILLGRGGWQIPQNLRASHGPRPDVPLILIDLLLLGVTLLLPDKFDGFLHLRALLLLEDGIWDPHIL